MKALTRLTHPILILEQIRGSDTSDEPNVYGYGTILIWKFNFDGNGTAIVSYDDNSELESCFGEDLEQRKAGGDVFPTGAHAANVLGLSDQVPMRSWHLTTGASRRIRNGKSEIILRHISPRYVSTKNPKSAQVILALRWIGKRAVDDDVISKLRRNLSQSDRSALPADAACAPAWIADIFHRLAQDPTAA